MDCAKNLMVGMRWMFPEQTAINLATIIDRTIDKKLESDNTIEDVEPESESEDY